MKKLLLNLFVLTPLSALQTFFAMGFINSIIELGGDGDDIVLTLGGLILFPVLLVGVNKFYTAIRFGNDSTILIILEFIISPIRLILQLITDIIAIVGLFADFTVAPRTYPDLTDDGLLGVLTIYLLGFAPYSKEYSRDDLDGKKQRRGSKSAASTSSGTQSSGASSSSGSRHSDEKALNSAIQRGICGRRHAFLPYNGTDTVEWDGHICKSISGSTIKITGTIIVSNFVGNDSDMSLLNQRARYLQQKAQDDIMNELSTIVRDVATTNWNLNVGIGVKVKGK